MNRHFRFFARLYLIWAASSAITGWGLSVIRALTIWGYVVMLPLVMAALIWLLKDEGNSIPSCSRTFRWKTFWKRFHRPLPFIFLIVAILTFLGGILYPPTNYDALTYRLPRMLNWLSEKGWFWIPTVNDRMNYTSTGWEWMAMPLLVLFRSDRLFFLINVFGFLLLPGMFFSIFRQLGVAGRVAWMWMWILPLGYGYVTQAGGIANDLLGALFFLMAIHYGLSARRSKRVQDVWLALLASALATGAKLSNLPLALPCLIAIWPTVLNLRQKCIKSAAIIVIAALVSIAPIMVLNQINSGSWSGDPQNLTQIRLNNPVAAFLGNSLLLLQQLLMPPVFPGAHQVTDWLNRSMPVTWHDTLQNDFPRYFMGRINELPQEESAGLGIGITLLVLLAIAWGLIHRQKSGRNRPISVSTWLIFGTTCFAVFYYMCKMGSEATARLMIPYYALVILPVLLFSGQERLVRTRGWKVLAVLVSISVLPAVIFSASRPLWPALPVSQWLTRRYPDSEMAKRMESVYSVYAHRSNLFAPLTAALPNDAHEIGFVGGSNDSDYSLWRPFGRRKVKYLLCENSQTFSAPDNLEWVVIKQEAWSQLSKIPLEQWVVQHHARIIMTVSIDVFLSGKAETWHLLRIEKS